MARRPFMLFAGALLAMGLAACNATSAQVTSLVVAANTIATVAGKQEFVDKVQREATTYCRFEPTVNMLLAVAKTYQPKTAVTAGLVSEAVRGICAAYQNPTEAYAQDSGGSARGGTYRGVPARGTPK